MAGYRSGDVDGIAIEILRFERGKLVAPNELLCHGLRP